MIYVINHSFNRAAETTGSHHSFNIRSMTPAFDRSSSLTPPGSSRPGAAFWRACVAFFCQKRAVLVVWCGDWSCQKNVEQHATKEWVFL